MIYHSTHGNRLHSILASDAAEIGSEARFEFWINEGEPFFGAKDTMHEIADVRNEPLWEILSVVRFADLIVICESVLSDESLDYFQSSAART